MTKTPYTAGITKSRRKHVENISDFDSDDEGGPKTVRLLNVSTYQKLA